MNRRFQRWVAVLVFLALPCLGWGIEALLGFPLTHVLARDAIEFVEPRADDIFRTFSGR
jgi:hypothetical protein